jgi:hypothetical protein
VLLRRVLDPRAVERVALGGEDGDLLVLEVDELLGVAREGGRLRRDEHLALADAHEQRRAVLHGQYLVGMLLVLLMDDDDDDDVHHDKDVHSECVSRIQRAVSVLFRLEGMQKRERERESGTRMARPQVPSRRSCVFFTASRRDIPWLTYTPSWREQERRQDRTVR